MPRFWRLLLLALLMAVAWLALTPAPPAALDTGWDKLNHAIAFTAMAVAGRFGFPGSRWRLLAIACGLLLFGAVIEGLQWFVPNRAPELKDWLADGVGVAAGLALAAAIHHFSSNTLQSV